MQPTFMPRATQSLTSLWNGIVLCLAFLTVFSTAHAQTPKAAPLTIKPETAYRLTFDATGQKENDSWWVHMQDGQGDMRYEGAVQDDWQKLVPGEKSYIHLFYSPADAATLELIAPANVSISNIKLEEIVSDNLFLNGDFSVDNFSGWSENYDSQFQKDDQGNRFLRVEHNGYAFTDYTPIKGGGTYVFNYKKLMGAWPKLLVYDANHRQLTPTRKPGSSYEMPKEAAYVRALFTGWHDHIEKYRLFEIASVSLTAKENTDAVSTASPSKIDQDWEIVLSPSSDAREEHAAHELKYWMSKITGKTPTLLAAPSKSKAKTIFIGRAWAKDFADDLKELEGSDGFALRNKNGDLYVISVNPRGSLYGVYSLLERNTDIIWPRQNLQFEAIYTEKDKIDFPNANIVSRPTFSTRQVAIGVIWSRIFAPGKADLDSIRQLRWGQGTSITAGYGAHKLVWTIPSSAGFQAMSEKMILASFL